MQAVFIAEAWVVDILYQGYSIYIHICSIWALGWESNVQRGIAGTVRVLKAGWKEGRVGPWRKAP